MKPELNAEFSKIYMDVPLVGNQGIKDFVEKHSNELTPDELTKISELGADLTRLNYTNTSDENFLRLLNEIFELSNPINKT